MAKALFHKSQRVFVKPVGTWAVIEQVVPHWVKDVAEPLRITYDCGLGRLFQGQELVSEQAMRKENRAPDNDEDEVLLEQWHIERRPIKWRANGFNVRFGEAGTYPVVATDEDNPNGWRVSGSEYDRDPERIEHQARMIVQTPELLRVARALAEFGSAHADRVPAELAPAVQLSASILRSVYQIDDDTLVAAE